MSTTRMRELAAFLEKLPAEQFNMECTLSTCGSVGCIAGWAVHLFAPEALPALPTHSFSWAPSLSRPIQYVQVYGWASLAEQARLLLGLSERTAERLFSRSCWPEAYYVRGTRFGESKPMAIKLLRDTADAYDAAHAVVGAKEPAPEVVYA